MKSQNLGKPVSIDARPICCSLEDEARAMAGLLPRFNGDGACLGFKPAERLANCVDEDLSLATLYLECLAEIPCLHRQLLQASACGRLDIEAANNAVSMSVAKRAVHRAHQAMVTLLAARVG